MYQTYYTQSAGQPANNAAEHELLAAAVDAWASNCGALFAGSGGQSVLIDLDDDEDMRWVEHVEGAYATGAMADRIGCGVDGDTTVESTKGLMLDSELVDGAIVIDPLYYATDCGGGIGEGFETAEEAVKDFAGSFDAPEETDWLEIFTFRKGVDADGDIVRVDVERHAHTLHPDEPECTDGEHDWQSPFEIVGGCKENPGVWGHGGGVRIHECCMKCGCERVTDTWAQNRSNGEQGLESTSYEAGKYADEIAALNEAEAE